jgi:hypothetical protein
VYSIHSKTASFAGEKVQSRAATYRGRRYSSTFQDSYLTWTEAVQSRAATYPGQSKSVSNLERHRIISKSATFRMEGSSGQGSYLPWKKAVLSRTATYLGRRQYRAGQLPTQDRASLCLIWRGTEYKASQPPSGWKAVQDKAATYLGRKQYCDCAGQLPTLDGGSSEQGSSLSWKKAVPSRAATYLGRRHNRASQLPTLVGDRAGQLTTQKRGNTEKDNCLPRRKHCRAL